MPAHRASPPSAVAGTNFATQSGSRRASTTLSSTTLTGHGAARLIAVSTTIAKNTAASSSRYGRTSARIRRITSVAPLLGRYGGGDGRIGQVPQLGDSLVNGAGVGADLRFRGAACPQPRPQLLISDVREVGHQPPN